MLRVLLGGVTDDEAWLSHCEHHQAERERKTKADFGDLIGKIAEEANQARRGHRAGSGIRTMRLCALLDPQRTQSLFGGGGQSDWSTIEIRFFSALDEPLIQLAIGFWARRPADPFVTGEDDALREPIDIEAFRQRCDQRADRSAEYADRLKGFPAWMCAGSPAQFWVAIRPDMSDDSDLTAVLLGPSQPSPTGRPGVLRVADADGASPIYLLASSDAGSSAATLAELQDMEIQRAMEPHLINLDLELWRAHLDVYELVAGNLGTLWDAVAIRLPAVEGVYLDLVQTLMRRIHQMFTQGMADLAGSASQIVRQAARAKDLTEQVGRLGGSPTTPGSTERLLRLAGDVPEHARRVTEHYKDLLQAIAYAFDERRVHGLDSRTNTGTRLAIVFGVFALVSVFDFLFDVKHEVDGLWQWMIIAIMVALVSVVSGFAASLWWRWRLVTRSGNRWFTEQYPRLVRYHYASSTETLRQRPANKLTLWQAADADLVEQFADLWREAVKRHPDPGNRADVGKWVSRSEDIRLLTARIESRMIMLLLLAERPPRLHRYRLPKLTLLLRYVAWLPTPEDFLQGVDLTVVSLDELHMALLPIREFTRDEVATLDPEVKEKIDDREIGTVNDLVNWIRQKCPDDRPDAG
jgi:hypothetical protein